jgi:hypothetical protein
MKQPPRGAPLVRSHDEAIGEHLKQPCEEVRKHGARW